MSMSPTSQSSDRVVVITGAARGIGLGLARHFAARGALVVMNDSGAALDGAAGADPELVLREAEAIRKSGGRAFASNDSIARPETAAALAALAVREGGRLDVWINGAAVMRGRMIWGVTDEDWRAAVDPTLDGAFYGTRAAAKVMREAKRGSIINLISAAGLVGNIGVSGYAAAKGGVAALTRAAALELRRAGVAVNAVVPFAATRMTDAIKGGTPEVDAYLAGARQARVEHLFPLFDHLVSPAPDVTGQIFGVRGPNVFVFSQPRPAAIVRLGEGEALGARFDEILRPALVPVETELEVFGGGPFAPEGTS